MKYVNCKGYLTEIGWRDNKYIPPFVVFEENVTEEILKWMSKFPQIVKDSCIISRLMDDIVAHEVIFYYFTQNS